MYTTQLDALLTHVGIGADVEFIDIQRFNPQTGHYVQVAWFTTPWFRWWFSYDLNVPVDGLVHVEYDEQIDVHQLRQYIADLAKHNDAEDVWVSWYMGGNPRVLHKLSLASLELPFQQYRRGTSNRAPLFTQNKDYCVWSRLTKKTLQLWQNKLAKRQ